MRVMYSGDWSDLGPSRRFGWAVVTSRVPPMASASRITLHLRPLGNLGFSSAEDEVVRMAHGHMADPNTVSVASGVTVRDCSIFYVETLLGFASCDMSNASILGIPVSTIMKELHEVIKDQETQSYGHEPRPAR